MDGPEYLTVQQAAERAQKSETGIRSAMLRNPERLPITEKYGRKLLRTTDVDAYFSSAKRGRPKKPQAGQP